MNLKRLNLKFLKNFHRSNMNNILGNIAYYSDETISISELNLSSYVTTESLLTNKQGKCDSVKLPPNSEKCTSFKKGDILVANIRPYLKKIWLADIDGGCSADVLVFKCKEGILPSFLYYSLLRDDFFVHSMKGSTGTKMPRGDKDHLLEFLIPDFDYAKQEKISQVLSVLDAKIILNNKINIELEAMAKLIYDYWFVQFDFPNENGKPYKSSGGKMVYNEDLNQEIPNDWEVCPLREWLTSEKSGDWGKESAQDNHTIKVTCIRGSDLSGLNGEEEEKAPTRFIHQNNKDRVLSNFDMIIEISGGSPTQSTGRIAAITPGLQNRFQNPLICSNFCKPISMNDSDYFYNFLYQWKNFYSTGLLFKWEGKTSGIKNLLFENFVDNYKTIKPPKEIAKNFNKLILSLEEKKQNLLIEIKELKSLRDWLLPMLMNGQVTVS